MDCCYYSHNLLLYRRLVEHKEVKQHRQDCIAHYRTLGHKPGRLDFWSDVLSVTRLIAQQQRAWFLCGLLRILWYAEVSLHRTYKKDVCTVGLETVTLLLSWHYASLADRWHTYCLELYDSLVTYRKAPFMRTKQAVLYARTMQISSLVV